MTLDYGTAIALLCLGLYCVMTKTDLIKIVIGINIMESAILLFLVRLAAAPGDRAPIYPAESNVPPAIVFADPIPQALSLTQIVINAAITAIMLSFVVKLYQSYRTIDLAEIRRIQH
ncbi:MAG: cation:proton antiporter subunit C [Thermoguttaceae bacterium]|jgi:multicomponent Na+:H+ antiporter subunit C|nr:cation:proton antiporter subunit C [Thermoguttaceae bacterium]